MLGLATFHMRLPFFVEQNKQKDQRRTIIQLEPINIINKKNNKMKFNPDDSDSDSD